MKLLRSSRKKLAYYVIPVAVIAALALGKHRFDNFVSELELSGREFAKSATVSVTKNWNYKELLSRGSKEFNEEVRIPELIRLFNLYAERLGNLKAVVDSHGNAKIDVGLKGVKIKAHYITQAVYEKGRATIDTTLVFRDKMWQIEKFSVSYPGIALTKEEKQRTDSGAGKSPEKKAEKDVLSRSKASEIGKDEKEFDMENFSYTSKNKRDPFFALVLDQRKRAVRDKMEKGGYELEELKVVGVLKTDREKFVMMEDRQGNGILFKKGDYVTKSLWIEEIGDDRIVYGYKLKNEIRTIIADLPGRK